MWLFLLREKSPCNESVCPPFTTRGWREAPGDCRKPRPRTYRGTRTRFCQLRITHYQLGKAPACEICPKTPLIILLAKICGILYNFYGFRAGTPCAASQGSPPQIIRGPTLLHPYSARATAKKGGKFRRAGGAAVWRPAVMLFGFRPGERGEVRGGVLPTASEYGNSVSEGNQEDL